MAKTTNNETTLQKAVRLSDNFLQKLDAYRLRPDNIHSKELDKARKKLDEFIAHITTPFLTHRANGRQNQRHRRYAGNGKGITAR